jgi:hypothetical protein
VGPIGVDPGVQGGGIGRALMEAMIERAGDAPGIRLMQDAFNTGSLSLYASLGFEVKEPMALVRGTPRSEPSSGVEVRRLREEDLPACEELCAAVYGFPRYELRDPLFHPIVALRDEEIVAYAATGSLGMGAHGVARSEGAMHALLLGIGARSREELTFLLPMRQAGFFRWALTEGFRVVKVMNLMAYGEYEDPRGTYFPSVAY